MSNLHPVFTQALRPFVPKPQTLSVHPSTVVKTVEVLKGKDLILISEMTGVDADKDDAIPGLLVEVLEASSPREQDLALQHLALKLVHNALAYIEACYPPETERDYEADVMREEAFFDAKERARDMNATRPLAYI